VHLTRKASYGVIAALGLAKCADGRPVPARRLAADYGLPQAFVEKILHEMKGAGLVRARQGRGGGYALSRPPGEVSVGDVLAALDESLDLVGCLDPASEESCDLLDRCPTRSTWKTINARFREMLDSMTVADLATGGPQPPASLDKQT